MSAAPWPAPAKINLFLHVLGRRDDGYHELQTGFQFLDLADRIDIAVRADGRVRREGGLPGLDEAKDLAVRAALALREAAASGLGADIRIDKRIPDGGGLGGGSSDAATVLVALNRLWGCGLDTDELAGIALALGADVPVFVRGQAAIGEGVGERLTPVEFPERWALVVHPGVHVPTAEVFGAPELTRNSAPLTMRAVLAGGGRNDCETVARERFPAVDEAMRWLQRFGEARLTGTGACVFALFGTEAPAAEALAQLPPRWRGFLARTCNRSSLLDRLDAE